MAAPPIPDEQLQAAVDALATHGTQIAAAAALKMSRQGFQNRLQRAAERGIMGYEPVLPGFAAKSISSRAPDGAWVKQTKAPGEVFELPAWHSVKGVSALVDSEDRVIQKWVKTQAEPQAIDIAETLKKAFENYAPAAAPTPPPSVVAEDLLTLYPLADLHLGMFSWGAETGTNWDLKIAEKVLGDTMESVVAGSPRSGTAVVLGGGDLIHSDNQENRTARSGNQLDVDGRYQKIVMAASRLVVRKVDACLAHHARVIVRILKGNHDEHSSIAVAYFLLAWYRNEPRVEVDVDPSLFWWHKFGTVLLGATHGHEAKAKDMPAIMAHRRAVDWGATKHRHAHTFHLHHTAKIRDTISGVVVEVHESPAPQDAWHWGCGYLSGRSMQSITYDARFGELARYHQVILDGGGA